MVRIENSPDWCAVGLKLDREVENIHPVSAMLTGHFSGRTTTPVTYTLSHPNYLFGQTTYSQTARYCPQPPEEDDDDDPPSGDPSWYDGDDDDDDEEHYCWCCFWGSCYPGCGCGCACDIGEGDDEPDEPVDPEPEDYDEASTNYPHMSGVLKIRDPLEYTAPIHLTVPLEHRNCCPCPDHATNWVSVVYKSNRLKVIDAATEMDFHSSGESLDVKIAGVSPSFAVGDAGVSFAANGDVCLECAYTVLGVGINGGYIPNVGDADLKMLNEYNSQFGLPIPINTNLWNAVELKLQTNVRLPSGNIHLGFEDSTAPFEVWIYDSWTGEFRKLASSSGSSLDISFAGWRQLVSGSSDSYSPTTWIYITAADAGKATLVYKYWGVIDGKIVEDEARQVITAIAPTIRGDVNHDGEINDADAALQVAGVPFRFWYNDETVKGEYVGQDDNTAPNGGDDKVNGKYDLINLFPLEIDVSKFDEAWGTDVQVRLCADSRGLKFCILNGLMSDDVAAMQTTAIQTDRYEPLESASLFALDNSGTNLTSVLRSRGAKALLAFEAGSALGDWSSPRLVVSLGGSDIYSYRIPLSISSVDDMYRYLNLRGAESDPQFVPVMPGAPWNCPDAETDSKHFVFVHGYDVSATQSRLWARAIFKRLWWTGSKSKFTAVDWFGNDSQINIPTVGEVSPNYYINVQHAFMTAEALKNACALLPGNKVMLAHSLGNMLVSAAAKDFNLQYDKYYMLNAAVPMEAYDVDVANDLMVDGAWRNLGGRFRASHFYELFSSDVSDFRSKLSWKGRFAGIHDALNCYSSKEDILKNPSEIKVFGFSIGETTGGFWSKQELFKGCALWYGVNSITFAGTRIEGGWGINASYAGNPLAYIPVVGFIPLYFSNYTRVDLITNPLYTSFNDDRMASTNSLVLVDYALRAKMLGDAIPAESFAAGRNEIDGVDGNLDMDGLTGESWPSDREGWYHSDLRNVSFWFTHGIFEKIKKGQL